MRTFLIISSLLFTTMTVVGCENDGPVEEAGEAVDEAAQDIGNAVEDACEDAKEGAGASDQDC
jgi:predicted small secreted protein